MNAARAGGFTSVRPMNAPIDAGRTATSRSCKRATVRRAAAPATSECSRAPIELPPLVEALWWHSRATADPAHAWLRARIGEVANTLIA